MHRLLKESQMPRELQVFFTSGPPSTTAEMEEQPPASPTKQLSPRKGSLSRRSSFSPTTAVSPTKQPIAGAPNARRSSLTQQTPPPPPFAPEEDDMKDAVAVSSSSSVVSGGPTSVVVGSWTRVNRRWTRGAGKAERPDESSHCHPSSTTNVSSSERPLVANKKSRSFRWNNHGRHHWREDDENENADVASVSSAPDRIHGGFWGRIHPKRIRHHCNNDDPDDDDNLSVSSMPDYLGTSNDHAGVVDFGEEEEITFDSNPDEHGMTTASSVRNIMSPPPKVATTTPTTSLPKQSLLSRLFWKSKERRRRRKLQQQQQQQQKEQDDSASSAMFDFSAGSFDFELASLCDAKCLSPSKPATTSHSKPPVALEIVVQARSPPTSPRPMHQSRCQHGAAFQVHPIDTQDMDRLIMDESKTDDAVLVKRDEQEEDGSILSLLSGILSMWTTEHTTPLSQTRPSPEEADQPKLKSCLKKVQHDNNNNSDKKISSPIPRFSVAFSVVQVREYELVVGDNPACLVGPPISLGWAYQQVTPDVDIHEHADRPKRTRGQFRLPPAKRKHLLVEEWQVCEQEIRNARREVTFIQYCREKTLTSCRSRNALIEEATVQSYAPPVAPQPNDTSTSTSSSSMGGVPEGTGPPLLPPPTRFGRCNSLEYYGPLPKTSKTCPIRSPTTTRHFVEV